MKTIIHNNRTDRFTLYTFTSDNKRCDLYTGYAPEIEQVVQDIREGRVSFVPKDAALVYEIAK